MSRLDSKTTANVFKAFKIKLQDKGISIRRSNQHLTLLFSAKGTSSKFDLHFMDSEEDLLTVKIRGSYEVDVYQDCLDFSIQLGRVIGVKYLMIEGNDIPEVLATLNCKPFIFETTDQKFIKRFIRDCSLDSDLYYKNLSEDYVENKMNAYNGLNQLFSELARKEPTTTFVLDESEKNLVVFDYYYQGYDGRISINTEERTMEETTLNSVHMIEDFSQLDFIFEIVIEKVLHQVKLKNLITPPKKHFEEYFQNHFRYIYDDSMVNDTYEVLSVLIPEDEFENEMVKLQQPKVYTANDYVIAFPLLSHFFVWNFETKKVTVVNSIEVLQIAYEQECILNENIRHERELSHIKTTTTYMGTFFE